MFPKKSVPRLVILTIDESRRLYKLLENFQKMKNIPAGQIQSEVMNRLGKRKKEIKSELDDLTERVKVVIARQYFFQGATIKRSHKTKVI